MKPLIKEIEGRKKYGKNVLVIAGVHGDELTPIYAVSKMLEKNSFNGVLDHFSKITVINGLNISGLRNNSREIASNSTQDLNRMFSKETPVECVEILKNNIEKNDVIIDIHSSPNCANFALIDIDEYTESIMNWCDDANIICAFRYSGADTIKRYCLDQGKLAVTIELNKMNVVDKDSAHDCEKMVNNLIVKSSDFKLKKSDFTIKEPLRELKTHKEGIIDNYKKNGEYISEGSVICEIFDFEMMKIGDIKAETSGYVICQPSNDYVKRGDTVFLIQPE